MTTALKNVIEKISSLPSSEQNRIAKMIAEELAWQKSFVTSQKELSSLAEEAVNEYKKGKTRALNLK